jgi:PAS domain S-box-containing protein
MVLDCFDRHVASHGREPYHNKVRYRHRDGSTVWVICAGRVIEWAEDGSPVRMVGCHVDITELKRTEEERREFQERYRLLFEAANDAIFVADAETGMMLDCNSRAEKLMGCSREELRTLHQTELHPSDKKEQYHHEFERATRQQGVIFSRMEIQRRDGTRVPVEISTAGNVRLGDREVHIGVFRDCSERIRLENERELLEQQLLRAQRLQSIGQLAGGVAHDFNNLLAAIVGYASLIRLEDEKPEVMQAHAKEILTASLRARDLTRNLLAFANQQTIKKKQLDLSESVEEVERLLRETISKSVAIETFFGDDLPSLVGDPAQISQILMNLCINAADSMGQEQGTLTISVRGVKFDANEPPPHPDLRAGRHSEISVTDTGPGIDPAHLDRVFDPFFTTKAPGEGSGLGLSTVYGLVQGHGGAVDVASTRGEGTKVTVWLPSSEVAPIGGEKRAGSIPPIAPGHGTILVVDDEEAVRKVAMRMLSKMGYDCIEAGGGAEALRLYEQNAARISLVLLDLAMPEMSGKETFARLKETDPDVGVLLFSGHPKEAGIKDLLESGAAGFLQKPFLPEQLRAAVAQALTERD